MAYVPPMFTRMDTLDHAIRDLILANPKRSDPSVRRVGTKVHGDSGFAAPLKRRRRTSPDAGDKPRGANDGRWSIHDLRGLDGRIAKDERVVAVESEDDRRRGRWRISTDENKFSAYSRVVRRTQEYSMGRMSMATDCNHCSIRVDSPSYARSLACIQRPERALTAMLMGTGCGETNASFVDLLHGFAAQSVLQLARSGSVSLSPHAPCRGRLMRAPFSTKGR